MSSYDDLNVKSLFLEWLQEWYLDAKSKEIKTQYMYAKAIKELKAYPEAIRSAYCAQKVKNIGPATVKRLEKNLTDYCERYGIDMPQPVAEVKEPANKKKKVSKPREYIPKKGSGASAILIAIYRASQRHEYKGYLTKAEISDFGQPFSYTSFTVPQAGSFYTAWSSMSSLLSKNMIKKWSANPVKFHLTEEGEILAEKLDKIQKEDEKLQASVEGQGSAGLPKKSGKNSKSRMTSKGSTVDRVSIASPNILTLGGDIFSPVSGDLEKRDLDGLQAVKRQKVYLDQSKSPSSSARRLKVSGADNSSTARRRANAELSQSFALDPHCYEIILLVDSSEHRGGKDKFQIQQKLQGLGVKTEVRRLALGDFLWIAQEKTGMNEWTLGRSVGREVVLDYVIERKRMDDLESSICDGRFLEQKFRFQAAEIKQKVYLIENYGRTENYKLTEDRLHAAIASTQVANGFFIKHTANANATIAYLAVMHKKILSMHRDTRFIAKGRGEQMYYDSDRSCCLVNSFTDYQATTTKTQRLPIKEMFAKHLMQIGGVTAVKAAAIVEKYPTPQALVAAYSELSDESSRAALLKRICYSSGLSMEPNRNLGPAASAAIAHLYTASELL